MSVLTRTVNFFYDHVHICDGGRFSVRCVVHFLLITVILLVGSAKVQHDTSNTASTRAAVYQGALRKHYTAVQRSLEIDVVDCIKSLRADGHVNDDGVKEARALMKSSGRAQALDHLCCVLEELSVEGMCYFVESVLPFQGLSQLVETFQACPGPGKCTLHHHDLHTTPSADVKGKVLDETDPESAVSSPLKDKVQTGVRMDHFPFAKVSFKNAVSTVSTRGEPVVYILPVLWLLHGKE